MNQRFLILGAFTLLTLVLVFELLKDLMNSAARSEYYSHVMLIPLVCAYLFWQKRKGIFSGPGPIHTQGLALSACGAALYAFGYSQAANLNQNDYTSLLVFSAIILWAGGFIFLYGIRGFQKGSFPVLFLLFMVPVPGWLMDKVIYALQVGSAEATEILFAMAGVPFQRDGFMFHLPGVSVEVAQQCSGIRSSLALFITGVLAGHLFLDRFWKKTVLAVLVFPVTVFKNGIRIVTLSLLGAYVDQRFLTGSFLHQSGGFLFFIPALGLLGLALLLLRKAGNGESGIRRRGE